MAGSRLSKFVQISSPSLPIAYAYRAGFDTSFDKVQLQFGLIYDNAATLNAIIGARVWIIDGGRGPGVDDGMVPTWNTTANPPSYTVPCNQQLDIPYGANFYIVIQFYSVGYYALVGNINIEYTLNSR